jgi:MscS family membrane protein
MQEFLRLARMQDWVGAAEFLAVPEASRADAPLLARRLTLVLDQKLALDVRALSPAAVGDTTDGDLAGDRIGVITSPTGREDAVRIVRASRGSPARWVFSTATVNSVATWYANLDAPWVRERVPPALMREGPWHVFYWQWIGLAIAIPVLVLLAWVMGTLLRGILTRLAARTATEWDDLMVLHLRGPFRLWVAAVAATPLLDVLELNTRVSTFVDALTRGLVLLSLFWGLLRVIRLVQERVANAVWASGDSQQARTLVPLLGNILRVTLGIIAVLIALSQFGYPVGTLLAGLGIGGIAVALAGQKTVEHLFGSVSLAADKAFRVGDWVRAGATEGTIERIGLRSTSFRTNDRTVVRIPNGRLADERIETFGERDRMFLRTDLDLTYGTSRAQIDAIRTDIEALLRAHPKIWPDAVRVHVVAFTESAIRMRVFAWFETPDWGEFLEIRHGMLLDFVDIIDTHGSSMAFPSRTVYHVTKDGEAPPAVPAPE